MLWLILFCLPLVCIRCVHSDVGDILAEEKTLSEAIIQSHTSALDNYLEDALAQLDQLSLVTRFTGTGYNIVEGNPEGDFNRGGVDPGVKTTNVIFAHTYSNGKKAFYQGRAMDVPDQVNFHMSESCASSHSVQAYSGRKSYMKVLDRSVSVSGGYSGLFASVSFSASYGMAKAESTTKNKKRIVIQKTKICNYGRARYLYENAIAREPEYTLSRSFHNSVKYQLPVTYDRDAYMMFIQKWGTHVIITVDVGTRNILRSTSTYKQAYKYLKKKHSLSTSVRGRYGAFHASASFNMNNLNENIDQNTNFGKKMTTFTIGSKAVPLPIHLDLKVLSAALDKNWWGGHNEWKNKSIDKKQSNLLKALKEYPKYIHAKKNTDPLIKVKIQQQWPGGTYALPQASWGCPRGWSSGYRHQDSENHHTKNRHSHGIEYKMRVKVGKDIDFHYCVKGSNTNSDIPWPKGTYCIAKKHECPDGFRPGSIKWDDENHHNKNRNWGVLPDGKYNKDTVVFFCCRSDGNYRSPMALPTNKPFILYRYGDRCQKVRGMYYSNLYLKWDDEDHHNRDKCEGMHPVASCRKDQNLNFCYYYKIKRNG